MINKNNTKTVNSISFKYMNNMGFPSALSNEKSLIMGPMTILGAGDLSIPADISNQKKS